MALACFLWIKDMKHLTTSAIQINIKYLESVNAEYQIFSNIADHAGHDENAVKQYGLAGNSSHKASSKRYDCRLWIKVFHQQPWTNVRRALEKYVLVQ